MPPETDPSPPGNRSQGPWERLRASVERGEIRLPSPRDFYHEFLNDIPFLFPHDLIARAIIRSLTVDDVLQDLRRRALGGDRAALHRVEAAARHLIPDAPGRVAEAEALSIELVRADFSPQPDHRFVPDSHGRPGWIITFLGEAIDWFPAGSDRQMSRDGTRSLRNLRAAVTRLLCRLEAPGRAADRSASAAGPSGPSTTRTRPAAPEGAVSLTPGDRVWAGPETGRYIGTFLEEIGSTFAIHLDQEPPGTRLTFHPDLVRRIRRSGEPGVLRVCGDCEHEVGRDSTCACLEGRPPLEPDRPD